MTARGTRVPELVAGDRLTRDEFERRYAAMPPGRKAELVEGVVYMASPVTHERHGGPHARLATWLGYYAAETPGLDFGIDSTVRLDLDNEPQPDLHLRLLPRHGGRATIESGYLAGPPDFAIEVTASRASYDLHDKKNAYRRNGVREYLVLRVDDAEVDWFVLRGGAYERLAPDADGVLRSEAFPGLWLDVPALLRDDLKALLRRVEAGLASPEHAAFAAKLTD